jgi:uncharacterized SAM-binding protein YcdF (DUF218 family)
VIAAIIVVGVHFVSFVGQLPVRLHETDNISADGIVVVTGGAERVAEGIRLLDAGRGQRLLISGVHVAATPAAIAEKAKVPFELFMCCVDLDRRAPNTIANAMEIKRWASQRRYRTIIVVTASYHMPRALNEIQAAAPDLTLLAYPVVPPGFEPAVWWQDWETFRLLSVEYFKYIITVLRIRVGLQPTLGLATRHAD